MSAYLIVDLDIHDLKSIEDYRSKALPLVAKAGGRLIALWMKLHWSWRAGKPPTCSSSSSRTRTLSVSSSLLVNTHRSLPSGKLRQDRASSRSTASEKSKIPTAPPTGRETIFGAAS